MKYSKADYFSRVHQIPEIKFEEQRLTSYSGVVLLQVLFRRLDLKGKLKKCFSHKRKGSVIGFPTVALILIVHLMIGFRKLRDIDRYREDPLVARVLGLKCMPHVSTVCRTLSRMDALAVENLKELNRAIVLDRLAEENISRITLDFDGSVIASSRYAEGLAVGYNAKKKGQRSYYPLFCTVAQSAQVLDVLHRSGNVHDSNGSVAFMKDCIANVRAKLPRIVIETRKDSAFFSDEIVTTLEEQKVEFTISLPFERFAELKEMIETRQRWKKIDDEWSCFETSWSPKCWSKNNRILIYRHKVKKQNKGPIQLDLFTPYEEGYEFRAIVTNKKGIAKNVLLFHNGRGSQENIFSELKSQCQMDYVPTRRQAGNQVYYLSAILSHNLFRELEMSTKAFERPTKAKRPTHWIFSDAATIRQTLIHLAGRLTRPQGKITLTMGGNEATKNDFLDYLNTLRKSA